MSKLFQKRKEDFVCEKCGQKVIGNGYTNHCPICLCSKHVDVNPGDREESCGGLMEPFFIESEGSKFFVWQRCKKCSHERRNLLGSNDSFEKAAEIMKKVADDFAKKGKVKNK
jgi:predicted metal-dependent hydrolase